MPKVLHIGPCETPGGMAKVMRILAEYPPEGWEAELLSSHVVGTPWAKWRAYRRARASFSQMLNDETRRPDIVHLHTAADWSWWRKRRFAKMAHKAGVPSIVHIHSGQFDTWLGSPDSKRSRGVRNFLKSIEVTTVVLSDDWNKRLHPYIGKLNVVNNPVDPRIKPSNKIREKDHLLLLGRNDSVKGHAFAEQIAALVRTKRPNLRLTMSGLESSQYEWVNARGWVSEEDKFDLLHTASLLLVPSAFEGQPLVVFEALASGLPVIASDRVPQTLPTVHVAAFGNSLNWVEMIHKVLDESIDADGLTESIANHRIEIINSHWKKMYENSFK
jgi:glycosyltransferase involved in cell wall biosynthesis